MFPYLDLPGFRARCKSMQPTDIDVIEAKRPGVTAQMVATRSSWLNSRLRKRYGTSPDLGGYIPLGQTAPAIVPGGTSPPQVQLVGRPVIGSIAVAIAIAAAGALGVATFTWTAPATFPKPVGPLVTSAAPVPLVGTGMSAVFTAGAYGLDNVYAAAPPVPETVLGWLVTMVTMDLYDVRGVNPQDPALVRLKEAYDVVLAEVKEAADSKDGLFDLPVSEDTDTAITTGGPLAYSETSPYTWADLQREQALAEDATQLVSTIGADLVEGT